MLKVGDALYLGEVIKASKAVVSIDNGKDVTILGNESVKLDNSVLANSDNTVADVSDLQKALLDGKDLTKLEETAAGGGDDIVTVGNWIREHSDINLGDGNDTVKVENDIIGTTIKLVAGDDTVIVGNKNITDNTITGKSNIDGGDGYDKLTITNPGTTINLSNIASQAHNFEELDISNKSQDTTLSVKLNRR